MRALETCVSPASRVPAQAMVASFRRAAGLFSVLLLGLHKEEDTFGNSHYWARGAAGVDIRQRRSVSQSKSKLCSSHRRPCCSLSSEARLNYPPTACSWAMRALARSCGMRGTGIEWYSGRRLGAWPAGLGCSPDKVSLALGAHSGAKPTGEHGQAGCLAGGPRGIPGLAVGQRCRVLKYEIIVLEAESYRICWKTTLH